MSLVWNGKNHVGFLGMGTRFYTVRVQKREHANLIASSHLNI